MKMTVRPTYLTMCAVSVFIVSCAAQKDAASGGDGKAQADGNVL